MPLVEVYPGMTNDILREGRLAIRAKTTTQLTLHVHSKRNNKRPQLRALTGLAQKPGGRNCFVERRPIGRVLTSVCRWDVRYFVLTRRALSWWADEADARLGKNPIKTVSLAESSLVYTLEPPTLRLECAAGKEITLRSLNWMQVDSGRIGPAVLNGWQEAFAMATKIVSRVVAAASPGAEVPRFSPLAFSDGDPGGAQEDSDASEEVWEILGEVDQRAQISPVRSSWARSNRWVAHLVRSIPDEPLGMGLWVNTVDQYLLVTEVASGTKADKAGVRPRDMIMTVNGVKGGETAKEMLQTTQGPLSLEILRFERLTPPPDATLQDSAQRTALHCALSAASFAAAAAERTPRAVQESRAAIELMLNRNRSPQSVRGSSGVASTAHASGPAAPPRYSALRHIYGEQDYRMSGGSDIAVELRAAQHESQGLPKQLSFKSAMLATPSAPAATGTPATPLRMVAAAEAAVEEAASTAADAAADEHSAAAHACEAVDRAGNRTAGGVMDRGIALFDRRTSGQASEEGHSEVAVSAAEAAEGPDTPRSLERLSIVGVSSLLITDFLGAEDGEDAEQAASSPFGRAVSF